jgi:hypothetical protein
MSKVRVWSCDWCGAENAHIDAECQFCDGGVNATPEERDRMAAALSGWVDPRTIVRDE